MRPAFAKGHGVAVWTAAWRCRPSMPAIVRLDRLSLARVRALQGQALCR
jgi:hypothetical protein